MTGTDKRIDFFRENLEQMADGDERTFAAWITGFPSDTARAGIPWK